MVGTTAAEAWIEITIPAKASPDIDLLRYVVDPLVHREFAAEIETWHFFFEPELRLRLRWRDDADQAADEMRLAEILDRWREEGRYEEWSTGNHGRQGERYIGETRAYGPEVWDLIQREWEIGSELALRLLSLNETEGGLTGDITPTLEAHWNRHVHLYTNRVFGFPSDAPWASEIVLCLSQARGYLLHALAELPKYKGYEALIRTYDQMEEHLSEAQRVWEARERV